MFGHNIIDKLIHLHLFFTAASKASVLFKRIFRPVDKGMLRFKYALLSVLSILLFWPAAGKAQENRLINTRSWLSKEIFATATFLINPGFKLF
jgi:hypothetical protein